MSYAPTMGVPLPRHGQGVLHNISVSDQNDRTERAVNLQGRNVKPQVITNGGRIGQPQVLTNCGRNVQPQVLTNQTNVLHQNTAFTTNDTFRQNIGSRGQTQPPIIHQYTSPVRQNIGGRSQPQPQPQPKVIQRQPTITYRQPVVDSETGSFSIFSFIGAIIATVCLVAFYILLAAQS